jgi:thiamine biosynthesis lipoprotein
MALVTHVRPRMGTLLAAILPQRSASHVATVFDTAAACEDVMSRHRAASPLSRLNRTRALACRELADVLRDARTLAEATGGAFDPTAGPLVDLWREAARRRALPGRRRIDAVRAAVGWSGIDVQGGRVTLARRRAAVDLGGFGKGVALDRIAARLRRDGCRTGFLNFGESSLVALAGPGRRPWRIALRHPRGGHVGEFLLSDRACSTSATYGQTLTIGSRSVSHVVDPRDGRPVPWLAQVTVIAPSASVAEAASTALLVSGRPAMDDLPERLDVEACWIDDRGILATPGFPLAIAA